MTFVIAYRDPGHANSSGVTIASSELDVTEAIERLRREGYEVTSITPPLTKRAPMLGPDDQPSREAVA